MMIYAGFWRRALSLIVDATLILFFFILYWKLLYGRSIAIALIGQLVLPILGYVYTIAFHAHWGQTIGKMVAKIKVTRLDGTKIYYKEAILRSSVDIFLSLIAIYGFIYAYMNLEAANWSTLTFSQQGALVAENNPTGNTYMFLSECWFWSELVVLLFNKKKRALHDFIAGTVVIHKVHKDIIS